MENGDSVLIVGAGPTGLSMGVALLAQNIPFRLIDKKINYLTTSNALAVQPRTLELWDDLGLINEALNRGFPLNKLVLYESNRQFDNKVELGSTNTNFLESTYNYVLSLPQSETEAMLREFLSKSGIHIELGTELIELRTINNNNIEILLRKNKDTEEIATVNWLIACDGIHSTVREQVAMPFTGKDLPQHFMMADVIIEGQLKHELTFFLERSGPLMIIPFSPTRCRVLIEVSKYPELKNKRVVSENHFLELVAKICPIKLPIKKFIWISGFWIHERIIPCYKHGHIFFAGDAAHVHSPAGGQGMNTGIQDVYNLAWKLASVIRKETSEELLKTYHQEKYPVATRVLARSAMMTRIATVKKPLLITLRNLLIKFFLKRKSLIKGFLTTNSQLAINYRKSTLTKECTKRSPGPKAGDRVLDCYFNKNDRFLDYLRGPAPCILMFSGILKDNYGQRLIEYISQLAKIYQAKFKYIIVFVTQVDVQQPNINPIYDLEQTLHRKYQVTLASLTLSGQIST